MKSPETPATNVEPSFEKGSRFKRVGNLIAATALTAMTSLGGDHAPSLQKEGGSTAEHSHSTARDTPTPSEIRAGENDLMSQSTLKALEKAICASWITLRDLARATYK